MLIPVVLRDARRRCGLSVRAAADRCGVPRATWSAWESGKTSPTLRRLDEVLAALALDLQLTPREAEPPGEQHVRRHLRRSLTDRARLALGEQLPHVLLAAATTPRLLTGPAAVGVWVPHVVARGPLPLPAAPTDPALVRLRLDVARVAAGAGSWVAVAAPSALVASGLATTWPGLLTSTRLLACEAPRDAAGRRLPPHRDPDESREIPDLAQTLTWGGRSFFPVSETDGRGWRLDGAATLDELLQSQGLPPRHRRPDAWRRQA